MSDESSRTADIIAAWLLYVLQLVFEAFLFIFLVVSVMAGDSCGSGVEPQPRVCSGTYFAWIFYGFAFSLLFATVATPVMIVVAGRRGWFRWLQPFLGIVFLVIATGVYFALLIQ